MPIYTRVLADGKTKVYDVKVSIKGNRKSKRGIRTMDAARNVERNLYTCRDGNFSKLTVTQLCWLWLEYVQGRRKPKTVSCYSDILRLHVLPTLGKRHIGDVKPTDIQMIIKDLGDRRRMANQTLTVLRSLYRQACVWELIDTNPAANIVREPDPPKEAKFLTIEEAARLVRVAEGQDHLLLMVALSSGMRPGELRGLTWPDVQGRELVVRDAKTQAGNRRVMIPASIAEMLEEARQPGGYVFQGPTGQQMTKDNFRRIIMRVAREANKGVKEEDKIKNIHPHTLRHSYACWLASNGENIMFISRQLGHTTPGFTLSKYGHFLESKKEAIVDRFEAETVTQLSHEQGEHLAKVVNIRR